MNIDLIDILLIAFVMTPLQLLFPMRRGQKILRKGLATDFCHLLMTGALVSFFTLSVLGIVYSIASQSPLAPLRESVFALPLLVQVVLILLIHDLGYYVAHRLQHASPVLWRYHTVHHSIEEMDWVAAYRVHPLDQTFLNIIAMTPIVALGFSVQAIIVFFFLYKWQSLIKHANISFDFGPFKRLIVSPAFHHWHHANERDAVDKNFAGQLAFYDYLFGTAYLPDERRVETYGVTAPPKLDYVSQLAFPFQRRRRNEAETLREASPSAA